MERIERIAKPLKRVDKFGEKFSFKYNGYDKYSTRVGGLVCLIFCMISLSIFIINSIPFVKRQNYNLQFYTVNLNKDENIDLNKNFAFGLDCGDKNKTLEANELFELSINFKNNTMNYSEIPDNITNTTSCSTEDFDDELKETIKNLKINGLKIKDFQCFLKNETKNKVQGIYTDSTFTYYKITVSAKKDKDFSEINDFLFKNDCKLQFYYTDYTIDIDNYVKPIKPLTNSLFLQINPYFYTKKNVFFMNYHFKNDDRLIHLFDKDYEKEEIIKTGFSRTEDYFIYKGENSTSNEYAKLFIRADNKRMEIKREYQNLLDFYAENTSFWFSIFGILNFIFTFYNDFHANRSMSRKLFFFEEKDNNKFNLLKRKNSISSTDTSIPRININDITINDFEEKEKKDEKNLTSMPIIHTAKVNNNFIVPSEKHLNREEEINIRKIKTKEEKENEEKKNKNPFSILDIFKISVFTCRENKLNFKEKQIKDAIDIFEKKLDIYIYIKNMILIDIMYQVLMNDVNKDYINFLSRSLLHLNKKKKEENEEINKFYQPTTKLGSDNSDKLYHEFLKLMEKPEKTEMEKKLICLFEDN